MPRRQRVEETMRRFRFKFASLLLVGALLPTTAYADKKTDAVRAEALFKEGRRLMDSRNYTEACPRFAESQVLDPAPGTELNLALCYQKAGRLATAWAALKTAQALAETAGQKSRAAAAKADAAALEPSLSRLIIAVPESSRVTGLEVRCDGDLIGTVEWGIAVPRDGGGHDIEASAPGKKVWQGHVDLKASGQSAIVEVPELEDLPVPSPIPVPVAVEAVPTAAPSHERAIANTPIVEAPPPPGHTQRIVAVVMAGAGVVAMGVGGLVGLQAKADDNTARDETGPARFDDSTSAVRLGNTASILVGIGAAVAVAGAVVWFAVPDRTAVGTNGRELLLQRSF
jgi:hypothetical protein